ncbi:neurofilament heavy polypeptide-like [Pyrus ussuriensis x Pyrus communis]|uniref:Neurofilament heavy polypeptide-like n=1 Tax=Pyrus ussuriensis x Pyrus communis TaxID=2448454 RepID=A0A5N5GL44_9ROSA|nr:neurofilament heavy polypeptide-like [Pyrus ussuriensis x Pyrus communis]
MQNQDRVQVDGEVESAASVSTPEFDETVPVFIGQQAQVKPLRINFNASDFGEASEAEAPKLMKPRNPMNKNKKPRK